MVDGWFLGEEARAARLGSAKVVDLGLHKRFFTSRLFRTAQTFL